ncbi:hypothetical protein [Streptomyces jumonjinensis]|uniref:hypothetical protein n=1 Tax=Streptomyces jumonjinensis TaxID=1945 RepID=UPI0037899213
MGALDGGLASQVFALAKDLAKVEKDVADLGTDGARVRSTLAGLDLGPVQDAIDHLEERTAGLQTDVQGLVPLREGLKALAKTVEQLRKDLEALAAGPAEEKLAVWDWSWGGMDQAQASEAWETLLTWVRTTLASQYGWVGPPSDVFAQTNAGYAASGSPGAPPRIPSCWYKHREAVWELGWLCQEWKKIYETSYGTPAKARDWYRDAQDVKRRLVTALGKCMEGAHQDEPWWHDRSSPQAPRGVDDDEQLSAWVGGDLGARRPAPAAGPVTASS